MKNLFSNKNLLITFIFLFSYHFCSFGFQEKKDSVNNWIKKSNNTNIDIKKRKAYLNKALKVIKDKQENSYKANILSQIAYKN